MALVNRSARKGRVGWQARSRCGRCGKNRVRGQFPTRADKSFSAPLTGVGADVRGTLPLPQPART
eukprot:585700-Rhodomonas_salina.1